MTTAEKLEEKGIEKGIHQTAIKMIQKGLNDDVIRECTGLTQKQIDKLRKENQ